MKENVLPKVWMYGQSIVSLQVVTGYGLQVLLVVAKYGDRLFKRLTESVNKRGINETILKNCRRFYLAYPQIKEYLTAISPTASEKSLGKSPTSSDKSLQISPTTSDKFITPGVELVFKLSFSHIVEILTVDDPLARFFYETECIRCCWNVKELRRQISTNLYFRAGVSKNPQLLIDRTEKNSLPALTSSPFLLMSSSFSM